MFLWSEISSLFWVFCFFLEVGRSRIDVFVKNKEGDDLSQTPVFRLKSDYRAESMSSPWSEGIHASVLRHHCSVCGARYTSAASSSNCGQKSSGTMFPGISFEREMHPNVSQVLTVEVLILAIACGVTSSSASYSAEDGLPNHV